MPAERIALAAQRRENELVDEHFRRKGSGSKRIAWLGLVVLVALALLIVALPVAAQPTAPGGEAGLPLLIGQSAGSTSYSVPVQTLLFFTALSFLPAVLLLMTAFTRIVIVLSLLRQALGTAGRAAEPGGDRPQPLPHLLRHGPDDRQGLRRRLRALREEPDRLRGSAQARREPGARVHDEADAAERRDAVRQARRRSTPP